MLACSLGTSPFSFLCHKKHLTESGISWCSVHRFFWCTGREVSVFLGFYLEMAQAGGCRWILIGEVPLPSGCCDCVPSAQTTGSRGYLHTKPVRTICARQRSEALCHSTSCNSHSSPVRYLSHRFIREEQTQRLDNFSCSEWVSWDLNPEFTIHYTIPAVQF